MQAITRIFMVAALLLIIADGEHESNGQSVELSRSTNYACIKPIILYYHEKSKIFFHVAPKIRACLANSDSINPDLHFRAIAYTRA